MIDVNLRDGASGNTAAVTDRGQLVIGPLNFSTAYSIAAALDDTAYNFVPPEQRKRFVITDILLYANKGVGAGDATVILYEALSATTATVTKEILNIEMVKQTSRDITGLNLICSEGRWINIKTNDNTVFSTVMGYYVDA